MELSKLEQDIVDKQCSKCKLWSSKGCNYDTRGDLRPIDDCQVLGENMRERNCPFCGDGDFDLIGLKAHLINKQCDVFNNTLSIGEERLLRAKQEG